jgi:hypothetical protein
VKDVAEPLRVMLTRSVSCEPQDGHELRETRAIAVECIGVTVGPAHSPPAQFLVSPNGLIVHPPVGGRAGSDFPYQTMMTGVPTSTRPNSSSDSGMCIRMHPWDA